MTQNDLEILIREETSEPVTADVDILAGTLRRRGDAACILFYGSGLWKQAAADTLYDFYVLVDRYQDYDRRWFHAALGAWMPPNVYYLEHAHDGRILRCKYAVMRMDQFGRAARGRAATPQVWARFAQPCRILYTRDRQVEKAAIGFFRDAVLTFHRHAIRLVGKSASAEKIWLAGLGKTYGSELRSERKNRTKQLFDANHAAFERRTELAMPLLSGTRRLLPPLPCAVQKFLAFARLVKATATFDSAVDYALWKIERQSGLRLQATERQRRHPLLYAWPLFWQAWKKGGLR